VSAAVRIEGRAFNESRLERLGQLAGYNRYEALGRMAHLWSACTDLETEVVSESVVYGALGERGLEALLGADLGQRVDGGIRIKGTTGRIEWLGSKRAASKAGGEAKKKASEGQKSPKRKPKRSQPGATGQPNGSPLSLSLSLSPSLLPPSGEEGYGEPEEPAAVTHSPSPHAETVRAFNDRYVAAYGVGPTWGERQGKQVKRLLKAHGAAEVQRRIGILFDFPPDWLTPPFDVGTLEQHFDKLAVPSRQPARASPRQAEDAWTRQMRRIAESEAEEEAERERRGS
jgi:hypothetical protein